MNVEIKVPVMGESVSEATVGGFIVPAGSYVVSDAEIMELETDKVNQVLYAPAAGAVSFTVSVGDKVKPGDVVGMIDSEAKKPEPKEASPVPSEKKREDGIKQPETPIPPVLKEEKEPVTEPSNGKTRKKMTALRKTIASRLVEVKNTTAMLTTFNEVDMTAVTEIRNLEKERFLERYGVKLGFMSFFVKACASALREFPIVNSYMEGDEIVTCSSCDMGIAVSAERGLLVPVIRGCEKLSFGEVEKQISSVAAKAREGKISIEDLKGGSFTITNGGVFGSLLSTPILNPPQSAILGMHAIVRRPMAKGEEVVIRPMMYVALSYDHRLIDGREAVLFLVHVKECLEDPSKLLLEL